MILTTHGVVGAAIALAIPQHPEIGIPIAFISHFLLDAIPHWDYHLKSSSENETDRMQSTLVFTKDTAVDLVKIFSDGALGVLLPLALFMPHSVYGLALLVFGAGAGMVPDFLQFVYHKYHPQFMTSLQRFHVWIHGARLPFMPVLGITLQIIIVLVTYELFNILNV